VAMTPLVRSEAAQCEGVVTGAEGAEAAPRPFRFLAATVQVYVFPELKSLTLIGDECRVFERDRPPLLDVHTALYSKIDDPPLPAGAENATVTLWCPAVAEVMAGAPGTVITGGASVTTGAELAEGAPEPTRFRAVTLHVYVFAAVRPLTRVGDACSVFGLRFPACTYF
jgi:hypothetical protein